MDFSEECNAIWNSSRRKSPEVVYHYTDAAGLIGMCETGKMWATRYDYLNDPVEDKFGRDLIASALRKTVEQQTNSLIKKFFMNTALGFSDRVLDFDNQWYIISFSEDGDDLSQWRSYANNGNGYSLGFNVNESNGLDGEFLHPVCYDIDAQMHLVDKAIKLCSDHLNSEDPTPNILNSASYSITPVLAGLSITMKQPAYKAEKEWRYIWQSEKNKHDHAKFRAGDRSKIIPYVELKLLGASGELDKLPINNVILGPQRGKDQSCIDLLLRKTFNKPLPINRSNIKYGSVSE